VHRVISSIYIIVFLCTQLAAQSGALPGGAANPVQPKESSKPGSPEVDASPQQPESITLKIPAGTRLDVEAAHTIDSSQVRPEDLISFRVLIPLVIDGVTVIEKGALVTARVVQAKRAGHWGKAGRIGWVMQDVVAVDGSRIPVQSELAQSKEGDQSHVSGTSHGAEVATKTAVLGALMIPVFPLAPLALMNGFKRGENAVIPEGLRFVVFVARDMTVQAARKTEED
jgi:hypothetical protein